MMEEEDEEEAKQKREARGVCRASQRGEPVELDANFLMMNKAANTGWGDNDNAKWNNNKYDGYKKERRYGNNQPNRIPSRAHDNEIELDDQSNRRKEKMLRKQDGEDKFVGRENTSRREEKRPGDYIDDEFEHRSRSRDDRHMKEQKRSRNGYDGRQPEPGDHRREDRRSIKQDYVEFERKSRVSDVKEDKRPSRQNVDDLGSKSRETHGNRDEMRSRKHTDDEAVPKSRNNRSYRIDTDQSESKERNDSDRREEKRSKR